MEYHKFTLSQIIMISTFSAIGFLLIVGFIISGCIWGMTLSRVIIFVLSLLGCTLIAVSVYFAIVGDIQWSVAGPIIGATFVFLIISIVLIEWCER